MTTLIVVSLHPGRFIRAVAEHNADASWVRIQMSPEVESVSYTIHIPHCQDHRIRATLLAATLNETLQPPCQPTASSH